jgi:rubrerythrin
MPKEKIIYMCEYCGYLNFDYTEVCHRCGKKQPKEKK